VGGAVGVDTGKPVRIATPTDGQTARMTEAIDIAAVTAPLVGTVARITCRVGDAVRAGAELMVIESMKMEHGVAVDADGVVRSIEVAVGDAVVRGQVLARVEWGATPAGATAERAASVLPDPAGFVNRGLRSDVAEVQARHAVGDDANRGDAIGKIHGRGRRTARENVADLVDDGSFVEYGPLVVAAQRRRRTVEELIERTPADGLVGGLARIGGAPAAVMSYDYTVLAGTQGFQNHRKKDRLFEVVERLRVPLVFFTEGGGGRPGDTDGIGPTGLDCLAFRLFAELSGRVPLVGIASGRCFAGNAALLGCCDVVIASADANIGMGGPAMIEGGGLGTFTPDEVGPMSVQVPNGVVDIAVADDAAAVDAARRYLSYFHGSSPSWTVSDQEHLRNLVPEDRKRAYDVRAVIDGLCDEGSVLELRAGFGIGMITALVRIEGRPMGLLANDPMHLGGAIDADAADKGARFLQLCDAYDLPVLTLCDTPGFMVGPEAEQTALVRHVSRLFVTAASITVPMATIVLRKGYGLGAQAMAGGSFKAPLFLVGWPTSEFGGMGLEGAVKLGFRRELDAVDDPEEREALFDSLVGRAYEVGRGLSTATYYEIDDVIDPADSRRWIATAFGAAPGADGGGWRSRSHKKRPMIDTW